MTEVTLAREGSVLLFLVAITVVAEIAQLAGVFDVAAHWAARAARGRAGVLWALIVALSIGCTVVLSLDTTAVLLTPIVLSVAAQAGLPPRLFALTTVWLANTGSLLLPVSNLTNLLALHRFSSTSVYLERMWLPALACIGITVGYLAALHHRDVRRRYEHGPRPVIRDRTLLVVAAVVCAALAPCFVAGITPAIPATVAAVILIAVVWARDRRLLRRIEVPWQMVLGAAALFIVVDYLGPHGLTGLARAMLGSGDEWRTAAVSALCANVINNLPAYLALEPAASTHALASVLVGVNAGSIVTPWGSLATLLWLGRCRRAGVPFSPLRYAGLSAGLAVLLLLAVPLTLG
ncbi:arsenic transporter [Calidifontibacter sp. DB0510]|uniref:Arsenic transporter n=1 Tax=Metallococcus carri TaxID=1656884 RepID=A0A967B3I4_9MICO|nr:SLC13 family permease [Metallococcus carri]NHN57352.1 arsenic transporter [Metallococcus carri]NOP39130.1 arsenic transporter [Calidifontibacter sp. DB2511S]